MFRDRARRSFTGVTIAAASLVAVHAGAQLRPAQRTTLAHPVSNNGSKYTIADFMSPASPLEITVAKKADRIAWITYDQGVRNVFTAAAPDFKPVKITSFTGDNGIDLTYVQLSDDGKIATFIRGSAQNREGWVANPSHDPNGPDRAVWAARTDGTGAWRLANIENREPATGFRGRGGIPQVSPDGRFVVFSRDGQLYRARIARGVTASVDTGGVPFIDEWGQQGDPVWSPDGSKLAFVSTRDNHSLIMVYVMATRTVK
jgi:dipeptidyl-peptidase-4